MKHEKEKHESMGSKHKEGKHHGMGKKEAGFGAKMKNHMGKHNSMEGPHK